jgi:type IX secretion system substrate protein
MKYIIIILLLFQAYNLSAELQWIQKHKEYMETIRTLECVDSTHCFAFVKGSKSVSRVYLSRDQGDTWNLIYELVPDLFKDSINRISRCDVVDSNHIFITFQSRIAVESSNDGGKTFKRHLFGEYSSYLNIGEIIYDFKMFNERIGIMNTDSYHAYTKDGWNTYKFIHRQKDDSSGNCLFFLDSNRVAMKKVIHTFDDFVVFDLTTETFEQYSERFPVEPGEESKDMIEVCFINDTLGFGCGSQETGNGDTDYNIIWKTTDKGKHWRVVNDNVGAISSFGLATIAFTADGKRGMTAANWGVMLETNDYGETWEYIDPPEVNLKATTPRMTFAGQYPLIATIAGGIHRQENVNSIEEYVDTNLKIYQSFDELIIELINKPASNLQFQIVDLLGRGIIRESYENQQIISIDLSQINTGFYMYRIISDGRVLRTGKIIR